MDGRGQKHVILVQSRSIVFLDKIAFRRSSFLGYSMQIGADDRNSDVSFFIFTPIVNRLIKTI